jgi:hypothetical protein
MSHLSVFTFRDRKAAGGRETQATAYTHRASLLLYAVTMKTVVALPAVAAAKGLSMSSRRGKTRQGAKARFYARRK